ncbi:hypothetical protein EDD17DRAFT_1497385 [Pisolithus thermaeus]|nr:hypothetical protein EDD17DRAFT_1497385 [Pisolithus thermaeus]
MVHSIDGSVKQYSVIYHCFRTTMITLGAKPEILNWYQELQKLHLTTSTAAFTQGVHDY